MSEFIYRTEDLKADEISKFFAETARDREIINNLKARNPVVLTGSRGVGKSFLLRVAETELLRDFSAQRVLPAYTTFSKSSVIYTAIPQQFQLWILARLCVAVRGALEKQGLILGNSSAFSLLSGGTQSSPSKMEEVTTLFEESWKIDEARFDVSAVPKVDDFRDAIEAICTQLKINRIVLLMDEAAHILLPDQQRQFFTLFRDLRSPYLSCKAAVYPGVTAYGDVFQPVHDATILKLERDVLSPEYLSNMREIVHKQGDSGTATAIAQRGENFAILAYASSGNPRILLKTLARAPRLQSSEINEVVREYFRNDIWSEHSSLGEKYEGHRTLIDWGRKFIEGNVLPELKEKNDQYLASDKNSSCFFWVHRDVPQPVKDSLRLLSYTGVVSEHSSGIKATRSEVGTRYAVNLGCLFALEATPAQTSFAIGKSLTPKRMTEFGANHSAFSDIHQFSVTPSAEDSQVLRRQLDKSIDVLDLTDWQKGKLRELNLMTLRQVLNASEAELKKAMFIGDVRARRMRNAAIAAVYEYLSG